MPLSHSGQRIGVRHEQMLCNGVASLAGHPRIPIPIPIPTAAARSDGRRVSDPWPSWDPGQAVAFTKHLYAGGPGGSDEQDCDAGWDEAYRGNQQKSFV